MHERSATTKRLLYSFVNPAPSSRKAVWVKTICGGGGGESSHKSWCAGGGNLWCSGLIFHNILPKESHFNLKFPFLIWK